MAIKLYGRDPLKLFENVFSETMTPLFSSMAPSFRVDVSEDEKSIFIDADMPGLKKEDVKISMDEDVLTICAERTHEEEEKKKDYHRIERSYGSMYNRANKMRNFVMEFEKFGQGKTAC